MLSWRFEPDTLNPLYSTTRTAGYILGFIANGLTKLDENLQPQLDLAEAIDTSPDGLTYNVKLRQGVKWHDGQPLTANDVKFTYQIPLHKDYTGGLGPDFQAIKGAAEYKAGTASEVSGIKVVDDRTLQITLDKVYAPFLGSTATTRIIPQHLLKDVPVADLAKADFSRNPVGTGPYQFVSWKSNEALTFKYYPDYFGQKGLPGQIIWRVIPDAATRQAELKSGAIHFLTDVPPDQFEALSKDPAFEAITYKGVSFNYLGYDLTKPIFQDKRVRQAITMAIDRQAIVTKLLAGKGEVAHSYFFPGSWTYNPNVKKLPYDVDRAKALLAEAGWKPGADGILEKDGEKLSFRYVVAQEIDNQLAIVIQQALKGIGIDARVERMDFNQMLSTYYQRGKFEAIGLSWGSGFFGDPTGGLAAMFGSELNRFSYNNPQLDELIQKSATTLNQTERKAIYDQIGDILSDDQPLTFLVWPDELAARSRRVEMPSRPTLLSAFHSVPQWYLAR